jgi:putative ABC transport system permease protein
MLATVATSVVLVVGIGAGHLVPAQLERAAAADAAVATLRADSVISSATGIDAGAIEVLAAADGVAAASRLVLSGGRIEQPFDGSHPDQPWPVRGIDASGAEVITEAVTSGALDDLVGASIAIPSATADQLGVDLGDGIALRLGDGALVELDVVATFDGQPGREALYVPADLLAPHTVSRSATTALVLGEPPSDAVPDGASVDGPDGLRAMVDVQLALQEFINQLLVGVAIAYAAVSVANTLAVGILARRREFALQRLTGSDTRQVRRMLRAELIVVTLIGALGGLVAAASAVVPTAIALRVTPFTPGGALVTALLVVAVIAILIPVARIATRRALRGLAGATVAAG